ncbi:MAG: UPF0149 family protein [Azoarcus sp.]|jgi:uncharacterized protein|nr:UPF0149 family protein [Azoarcus sp.]
MSSCSESSSLLLGDEERDALEAILVSDAVPEDCMDLEMLDGFLAGVLLSPVVIERECWLPEIWSVYGDADFGAGDAVQRAIRLVLAYYNEMTATLGRGVSPDPYREIPGANWEPFCFAVEEGDDSPGIGEGWIGGFTHGLELWPEDWQAGLPAEIADDVQSALQRIIAPWEGDEADIADNETRLGWLEAAGEAVNSIFVQWRSIGLPEPEPIEPEVSFSSSPKAGRNDPCSCGSGKKYKKCCGADHG